MPLCCPDHSETLSGCFRNQCPDATEICMGMSFEERFGLLVDAEWAARKSNRLTRLIKKADFAISGACVEDIDYHADRKLDKALIARLVTSTYIQEAHNVLILGATGVGKTYLGCALGTATCRSFYPVKYIRLPDLLGDLAIARGDGSYRKLIRQYRQVKLLILDEWLLFPLKETEARDLLEIVDARHRNALNNPDKFTPPFRSMGTICPGNGNQYSG